MYFLKVFLCRNKLQIGLGYLFEEDKRETTEEERFSDKTFIQGRNIPSELEKKQNKAKTL